jgi:hypothetical protein
MFSAGTPPGASAIDVDMRDADYSGRAAAQVHDWIFPSYEAEKSEGQPQPLDPPAAGRLNEVCVPAQLVVGTAD